MKASPQPPLRGSESQRVLCLHPGDLTGARPCQAGGPSGAWFPASHSFTAPVQHSFAVIHSRLHLGLAVPRPKWERPWAPGPGTRHPQAGMASKPSVCPLASEALGTRGQMEIAGGSQELTGRQAHSLSQLRPTRCPGLAGPSPQILEAELAWDRPRPPTWLCSAEVWAGVVFREGQGLPLLQAQPDIL